GREPEPARLTAKGEELRWLGGGEIGGPDLSLHEVRDLPRGRDRRRAAGRELAGVTAGDVDGPDRLLDGVGQVRRIRDLVLAVGRTTADEDDGRAVGGPGQRRDL